MNNVMRFLLALAAMFVCASSWAGSYYGKVTANVSPTGAGTVYVAESSDAAPSTDEYQATHSASKKSAETFDPSADVVFYVYAQPAAGYKFLKWTVSGGTLDNASQASGCKVTVNANGNESKPTEASVTANFEPLPRIPVPTAITGLVYDGTEKIGVKTGTGYALTGNTATAAGSHPATATLDADHLWEDGSSEPAEIIWTIQRKVVTVTAQNARKTFGEKDPERFAATVVGTLGSESVSYAVARVQGEDVGTWAIVPSGEAEQGNYAVSFANGTFTIVPRPILVSVAATSKYYGEADPEFKWTVSGTEAFPLAAGGVMPNGQPVELRGMLVRTAGEDVKDSPYDIDTLTSLNEANNPNYVFEEQLDGEDRFTILSRPTIEICIARGEGVSDVQTNGVSVVGDLELSAGTTKVTLELEAGGLTVPVYKVTTNGVTTVTKKTAAYPIASGDTLEFLAEEAADDPQADPEQIKTAIIDAIDPADPDDEEDVKRYDKAVAKVEAVVGEGANQVSAREFAAYINENQMMSKDIAESDYVAASVKLEEYWIG